MQTFALSKTTAIKAKKRPEVLNVDQYQRKKILSEYFIINNTKFALAILITCRIQ
jgi:hypothetical protein